MRTPEEYVEAAEQCFGIANGMLTREDSSPEEDLATATFYAQLGQGFAQLGQLAAARQGAPERSELARLTTELRGVREELRGLVGHLRTTR